MQMNRTKMLAAASAVLVMGTLSGARASSHLELTYQGPSTIVANGYADAAATLTDSGAPVADEAILFTLGELEFPATTDENGVAVTEILAELPLGPATLSIEAPELGVSTSVTLQVTARPVVFDYYQPYALAVTGAASPTGIASIDAFTFLLDEATGRRLAGTKLVCNPGCTTVNDPINVKFQLGSLPVVTGRTGSYSASGAIDSSWPPTLIKATLRPTTAAFGVPLKMTFDGKDIYGPKETTMLIDVWERSDEDDSHGGATHTGYVVFSNPSKGQIRVHTHGYDSGILEGATFQGASNALNVRYSGLDRHGNTLTVVGVQRAATATYTAIVQKTDGSIERYPILSRDGR